VLTLAGTVRETGKLMSALVPALTGKELRVPMSELRASMMNSDHSAA